MFGLLCLIVCCSVFDSGGMDLGKLIRKMLKNADDSFFKFWLRHGENAKHFLRDVFGARLASHFDLSNLEFCDGTWIDEDLRSFFGDSLMKVLYKGVGVNVYVLIEHKSYGDKYAMFQMLKYMIKIWDRECKERAKNFTPIIPVLYVHGKKEWAYGNKFSNLFDDRVKDLLGDFIPNYGSIVFDLNKISESDLSGPEDYIACVMIQKLIRGLPGNVADIANRLISVFKKYGDGSLLSGMFAYVLSFAKEDSESSIRKAFENLGEGGAFMSLLSKIDRESQERGRAEGEQLGLKRGREEGEQLGLKKGERRAKIELAKKMLARGGAYEDIAELTGLPVEEIELL